MPPLRHLQHFTVPLNLITKDGLGWQHRQDWEPFGPMPPQVKQLQEVPAPRNVWYPPNAFIDVPMLMKKEFIAFDYFR
jgi:hypothetical protein